MSKKKITRRDFIKKSALTGAGLALSSTLLGKKLFAGKKEEVGEKASAEAGWQIPRFDGVEINLSSIGGEMDDFPIRDKEKQFESETGMNLNVIDLGFMPYHDKMVNTLRTGTYAFDVSAVTPMWLAEVVTPGYLEDLSPYVANDKLTSLDTIDGLNGDFIPAFLNFAGWYNPHTQMPGKVNDSILYLLPGLHAGGSILAYRQDTLDNIGIKNPPDTWPEFNRLCKELARPKEDFYGTVITGKADATLVTVDFHCRFASQGGKYVTGTLAEKNVRANMYSDECINAVQWLKDVVPYCPPGIFAYGGSESSEPMMTGKAAMMANIITFAGRFWSHDLSKIADVVKAAELPGVGKYKGVGLGGGWSWGIPVTAKNKEAAWVAAQYFSSKAFDKYRTIKYGLAPVRMSTMADPEVNKAQPWTKAVLPFINKGNVPEYWYFPEAFEILDLHMRQTNIALTGAVPVDQAMKELNDQINAILKRAGWQDNL